MIATATAGVQPQQFPAGTEPGLFQWLFQCSIPANNVTNETNAPSTTVLLQPGSYVASVSRNGYSASAEPFTVAGPEPEMVTIDVPVSMTVTLS